MQQDFTNTTLFPTFLTIPEQDQDAETPPQEPWYLLAQVKDNMTITKPTLVLADRDASPFALVFEGIAGRDGLGLNALGLKKGFTAIIPSARRCTRPGPADGPAGRGFVRVECAGGGGGGSAGGVGAVPCSLARVLELGGKVRGVACDACGGEGEGGLRGCTGCGRAGYCSKVSKGVFLLMVYALVELLLTSDCVQECQVKGWNEGGHKKDCKILKTLNEIFKQ